MPSIPSTRRVLIRLCSRRGPCAIISVRSGAEASLTKTQCTRCMHSSGFSPKGYPIIGSRLLSSSSRPVVISKVEREAVACRPRRIRGALRNT